MRKWLYLLIAGCLAVAVAGRGAGGGTIPAPSLPGDIPSISLPTGSRSSVIATVVEVKRQDLPYVPYVLVAKDDNGKKRKFQLRDEILLFTVKSSHLYDARPVWSKDVVDQIEKGMKLEIYGKEAERERDGKTEKVFFVDAVTLA